MNRALFLAICVLLTASPSFGAQTILAFFAHPDDETTVGPLLAKYAAQGHSVHLAITTSGQVGDSNTDIPKGDPLGAAREEEARCAARALGIHPPELMQFLDGATAEWDTIRAIRARTREVVDSLAPDVIITWGPDGLSGHPDHRIASNVVTELFQRGDPSFASVQKLYYVAWPQSLFQQLPAAMREQSEAFARVEDRYVTTAVPAADFLAEAAEAVRCHKTQWSPEVMEQNSSLMKNIFQGKIYLRLALSKDVERVQMEEDILSGLP